MSTANTGVDPFPTPEYTVHVSLSHVILTLTLSPHSTVMLNTHKHQNSIHVYRSVSEEPHIFFHIMDRLFFGSIIHGTCQHDIIILP